MKAFANLFTELEQTTRTSEKEDALARYFTQAKSSDAVWALYFLLGNRFKRTVNTADLRLWVSEVTALPLWMVEECYDNVGDLAETLSLLLPDPAQTQDVPLGTIVKENIAPLVDSTSEARKPIIMGLLENLDNNQRFIFLKLITGNFRVGVAEKTVIRALTKVTKQSENILAHKLSGNWNPSETFFDNLLSNSDTEQEDASKPYPFCLAYPIEQNTKDLGEIGDWQVEWKWDGIRSQLIRRKGEVYLWSRGEELLTARFPELAKLATHFPDGCALDGEILVWENRNGDIPSSFAQLQKRIGRKTVGSKILADTPALFLAYDLLEFDGQDIRSLPLSERRAMLQKHFGELEHTETAFRVSPVVEETSWDALQLRFKEARERRVEGFMLKRKASTYGVGRKRGEWWKWKSDPYQIDAVLVYAQQGHGRRAGLYTDYTFGIWREGVLVPFAKAYSGLSDEEIKQVDSFIRKNTKDKFGPVRVVEPQLVFELSFEGIQKSSRHKSGIAVRFPRISRWRHDKKPEEADSLATVEALIDL